MKITLLGTGAPAPSLRRQSSGYVIEIGSDVIVMDHGPGAHHRLMEAGYKATDVTHFFLTHYHYDHVIEYPRLLLTRWDQGAGKIPELKVFGPDPLHEITDRFFGENGAFAYDLTARTEHPGSLAIYAARGGTGTRQKPKPELRQVAPGDVVDGNGWRVRVGPAWHFQPQLNCLAYRVETAEGSLVYSGDNGGVYEPFIEFAQNCDVLIHMNHSLSGTEGTEEARISSGRHMDVAETAKRAGAKILVLTHLLPQLDKVGVKERMVTEMADVFKGAIIVGEDLMEIPLKLAPPEMAD